MKFLRRPDLSPHTRARIALDAYLHLGMWGYMSQLARQYRVSRQFIYILIWAVTGLFEPKPSSPRDVAPKTIELRLDRLLIALKLQGHCSVGDISQIFKILEIENNSIGCISERLKEFASAIPTEERAQLSRCIVVLLDETFAAQRPILVVLEARSHYILEALWASDRKAQTWQALLEKLKTEGYVIEYAVADQGTGLRKGCEGAGLAHLPDLMHLLCPFGPFVSRFERKGLQAIQIEYDRQRVFENACSETNLQNRLEQYDEALRKAEDAMRLHEDYA